MERQVNYSRAYLDESGLLLRDYTGHCVELTGDVLFWLKGKGISGEPVWFEATERFSPMFGRCLRGRGRKTYWQYHCVPVVNGLVHDAWYPKDILTPNEYCRSVFPGQGAIWSYVKEKELDAEEVSEPGNAPKDIPGHVS